MARTERKSLFLRGMPPDLVREARAAAAHRGATLTAIVAEALARSLGARREPLCSTDALGRDIAWYRANQSMLLRRFRDKYVAIVGALAARVFARFGNRNSYMPRVQANEPTARRRSPRRSKP